MRIRRQAIVVMVVLGGCSGNPSAVSTVDVVSSSTAPPTSVATPTDSSVVATTQPATSGATLTAADPATTDPPMTDPAAEGAIVETADVVGQCVNDGPLAGGEVTVFVGDRIVGITSEGAMRCLIDGVVPEMFVGGDPIPLEWSPTGGSLRVGRTVVPSGLSSVAGADLVTLPEDSRDIEWTTPTGLRLVSVEGDRVAKIDADGSAEVDVTFLAETDEVAYHPAGTHILGAGADDFGDHGLWLADNLGQAETLIAFDEAAVISSPAWLWTGEPVFAAAHVDTGVHHVHRIDVVEGQTLDGPVLVESEDQIDRLMPSPFDPLLLAYRSGADDRGCSDSAQAMVMSIDTPGPLATLTSEPVGWLPGEQLVVLAHPDGCSSPGQIWIFTTGFCPGSEYGAELLVGDVDVAAVRVTRPEPPRSPDVADVPDAAPA